MIHHSQGARTAMRPRRAAVMLAALLTAAFCATASAAEAAPGAVILQKLRDFKECGRVLFIAAHPDDENTQLLTYLARGRHYRTAYLSLTRGDGGQNVLGPEFGEELGVIRTEELLAARRLDGAMQFFTRARDFGFSKNPVETLRIWDRQQVLADVVRVIRIFRPDVIITRFSPTQTNTHGHHTASAILGAEAFKLAGDAAAFAEQLGTLKPWQPKRIFVNGGGASAIHMDVSGDDPVLHISFSEIAARSRAMHKTQGFGNFAGRRRGAQVESFQLLDGAPAAGDILDGVDTSWGRFGAAAVPMEGAIDAAIAAFSVDNPASSIAAILAMKKELAGLPADSVLDEKRRMLDHVLQECLGLTVKTTVENAEVIPGETLHLHESVTLGADVPVRWIGDRYPATQGDVTAPLDLHAKHAAERDVEQTVPAATPVSQPYWLREEGSSGLFRVDDPTLIGLPENPPAFPIEHLFEVGGQQLRVADEPEDGRGRRVDVIAPVALRFPFEVKLFKPGLPAAMEIEVTAFRDHSAGQLALDLPAGWSGTPTDQRFDLRSRGDHALLTFTVTPPPRPGTATLNTHAEIGGRRYNTARQEIRYSHIPPLLLQPPATLKLVSLELETRGHAIGYLPGAGDSVAACLEQMGYVVTPLTTHDLTADSLRKFDAVVLGVRALNTRSDLSAGLPALFAYADAGGTLIEQYNRPDRLEALQPMPYPLHLSSSRVTDETAPITFLAPDHPVLNRPNKITPADFDNWVQERSIYLPTEWDDHFTAILAANDPGEPPLKGQLLIAPYGKGHVVYTGLVFFRQLPAGIPGAYRLFADMIALGK